MEEWDSAVFKLLAKNDTPAALGHQGGVVIPKDLENYFPPLKGLAEAGGPTVDVRLDADLLLGARAIGRAMPRYQFQTWGGTRSPERRLTAELRPLLEHASERDILTFQRNLSDPKRFLIRLIRKQDEEYDALVHGLPEGVRWGVLHEAPLLTNDEVDDAALALAELDPDELFEPGRAVVEAKAKSKSRSAAFRSGILKIYGDRCAVTGEGLVSPTGAIGIDAAHLIPVSLNGSDSPRNGIALRKDLHWAFDAGLWTLDEQNRVFVPLAIRSVPANRPLADLHQAPVRLPAPDVLRPHPEAIAWRFSHWQMRA